MLSGSAGACCIRLIGRYGGGSFSSRELARDCAKDGLVETKQTMTMQAASDVLARRPMPMRELLRRRDRFSADNSKGM
jgi:hypothetical protein